MFLSPKQEATMASTPTITAFASSTSAFVPRSFPSAYPTVTPLLPRPPTVPTFSIVRNSIAEPTPETQPLPTPVNKRSPFAPIIDIIRRDTGNLIYSPKYGPVYRSNQLGKNITIVSDLKAIAEIYTQNDLFITSDGAWPETFETLFGPSTLFIIGGEEHHARRQVVQPAFAPLLFQNYFPRIVESSYQLWDGLSDKVNRNGSTELLPLLKDHFLRIVIGITTGIEIDQADNEEFVRLCNLYIHFEGGFFTFPFGPLWKKALASREQLLTFYEDLIRQRLVRDADTIEKLRASGNDIAKVIRQDLKGGAIDILTVAIARSPLKVAQNQDHDPEALKKLSELMLLLWFAGYSTQATTMSCGIMELGFTKSIQQRLKAEQDQIMASSGTNQLTLDQVLKEMPLLDSFVSEVLRLYPAIATMPRLTTRDTIVCGHLVKKGTNIGLDTWWSQRDPKYFEDGNAFKLDRFIGDDAPMSITFGAKGGAHFCLGAALARVSLKVTLAVLLREYDLGLDTKQSRRIACFPAIQPATGVKVAECKRKEK